MPGLLTLLTDFGDLDGFVGAMRGVIIERHPDVRIEDIAHGLPMGDIAKASRVLARSAPFYPEGTVHCVVVDPGVGSLRRPVAIRCGGHIFVGPDNGVFGPVLSALGGRFEARAIENSDFFRRPVSDTFHGRDIFAPAAASLASGESFQAVGPPLENVAILEGASWHRDGDKWMALVVEVDRFGNLITDLPVAELTARYIVEVAGQRLSGPSRSYSAVESGGLLISNGSSGTVEIACRDQSAQARLGIGVGEWVTCFPWPEGRESRS